MHPEVRTVSPQIYLRKVTSASQIWPPQDSSILLRSILAPSIISTFFVAPLSMLIRRSREKTSVMHIWREEFAYTASPTCCRQ